MLGILLSAAILGAIIMVMEKGRFPGWWKMIACVLVACISQEVTTYLFPKLWIVRFVVGAVSAGIAISAMCGMSLMRASIAAGIYLVIQIVMVLCFFALIAYQISPRR